MSVLVDTNLLLRISAPDHFHHDKAIQSIELLVDQGRTLRTVPQNLYEYWVVATRPIDQNGLGLSPNETAAHLDRIKRYFPLLRDERAILDRWKQLVSHHAVRGRNAHDVRLVAAMERHGLTTILTFNASDFKRFGHISVLTPDYVIAS